MSLLFRPIGRAVEGVPAVGHRDERDAGITWNRAKKRSAQPPARRFGVKVSTIRKEALPVPNDTRDRG
jgi:hypothetical protein